MLAALADEVSGPTRRCLGPTDNELVGLVRAWAAIEFWAAAGKLGGIREMIRRHGMSSPGQRPRRPIRDLAAVAALRAGGRAGACSARSADTTAWLAWEQQARLPGTAGRLGDGTRTAAKDRAINGVLAAQRIALTEAERDPMRDGTPANPTAAAGPAVEMAVAPAPPAPAPRSASPHGCARATRSIQPSHSAHQASARLPSGQTVT